jgi:carboxymethylenebutenolidase
MGSKSLATLIKLKARNRNGYEYPILPKTLTKNLITLGSYQMKKILFIFSLIFIILSELINAEPTKGDTLPAAIIGDAGPLTGKELNYFIQDEKTSGYLAMPSTTGSHPAVILIHEWNGLVSRVKETADSFAEEGYIALAVDLYSGRVGSNREENMSLVQETLAHPKTIIANLNAAAEFLRNHKDSNGKVAAIGWCYGGGVALSFALGGDHHDATAIFYGRLLTNPEQLAHVDHEFYGTFVENDNGIPVQDVHDFTKALRSAGINNDIHIYDEVSHGFWLHVDRNPGINTGPAIDAWQRLKMFLQRNLYEL